LGIAFAASRDGSGIGALGIAARERMNERKVAAARTLEARR